MHIRRYTGTLVAFVVFLVALYSNGMIATFAFVPHETTQLSELYSVKQGVSQDGEFAITEDSAAPQIPPRQKIGNHSRTLRAFIGPNRVGAPSIFIELIRPHVFYTISGNFTVSQEFPTLSWVDPTTLQFYDLDASGVLFETQLDVRSLQAATRPVDATSIKNITVDSSLDSDL